MRSDNLLFILLILLCTSLATAETFPSVQLQTQTDPTDNIEASFSLGCATGADGPLSVTVSPVSEPKLLDSPFSFQVNDAEQTNVVPSELADKMCDKLKALGRFEEKTPVELEILYVGQCQGENLDRESSYTLYFDLVCTDVSRIHAPSGADPGPVGGFEMEAVEAKSPDGAGVAYQQAFGDSGRHLLRVALGIREESVTVPLTSDALALFPDETRIETDLKVVPVDVSYGFRLLPPDRRVVPTVYVGAGYAFAEVEVPTFRGGGFGDLLRPDLEVLRGSDEDSLTLNAGFSLRFNLGRGRGGKYLYLGARTRWYAQRDGDEADEEFFLGFGVPVAKSGWSRARPRAAIEPREPLGVQGEKGVDSGGP